MFVYNFYLISSDHRESDVKKILRGCPISPLHSKEVEKLRWRRIGIERGERVQGKPIVGHEPTCHEREREESGETDLVFRPCYLAIQHEGRGRVGPNRLIRFLLVQKGSRES